MRNLIIGGGVFLGRAVLAAARACTGLASQSQPSAGPPQAG